MQKRGKKGAIELSIGTIVIVVLALAMLVLGLVIVTKIGCGIIKGVGDLNEKTRQEIIDLFSNNPNEKLVIKELYNDVSKESPYGVGFGIRNTGSTKATFSYDISAKDLGKCKFSAEKANDFIILGKTNKDLEISSGEDYIGKFDLNIPNDVENCDFTYSINVKKNGELYVSKEVTIRIINKPFMKSYC